jgi:hypothetical protein
MIEESILKSYKKRPEKITQSKSKIHNRYVKKNPNKNPEKTNKNQA